MVGSGINTHLYMSVYMVSSFSDRKSHTSNLKKETNNMHPKYIISEYMVTHIYIQNVLI